MVKETQFISFKSCNLWAAVILYTDSTVTFMFIPKMCKQTFFILMKAIKTTKTMQIEVMAPYDRK